jgi:hypothetical protein
MADACMCHNLFRGAMAQWTGSCCYLTGTALTICVYRAGCRRWRLSGVYCSYYGLRRLMLNAVRYTEWPGSTFGWKILLSNNMFSCYFAYGFNMAETSYYMTEDIYFLCFGSWLRKRTGKLCWHKGILFWYGCRYAQRSPSSHGRNICFSDECEIYHGNRAKEVYSWCKDNSYFLKLRGLVRQRTIPTERPPHVGGVSANFSA